MSFLHDLQNKNFPMSSNDPNVNCKSITENFFDAIDKNAPLKEEIGKEVTGEKGNKAPFMNREFQKVIWTRTKLVRSF